MRAPPAAVPRMNPSRQLRLWKHENETARFARAAAHRQRQDAAPARHQPRRRRAAHEDTANTPAVADVLESRQTRLGKVFPLDEPALDVERDAREAELRRFLAPLGRRRRPAGTETRGTQARSRPLEQR